MKSTYGLPAFAKVLQVMVHPRVSFDVQSFDTVRTPEWRSAFNAKPKIYVEHKVSVFMIKIFRKLGLLNHIVSTLFVQSFHPRF
jgi:hypothetical protein